jgi:hypothetical protein
VLLIGEPSSFPFPLLSPLRTHGSLRDVMCWCSPCPGTQRYFIIQRALPQGYFPAARISIFLQAASLAILTAVVFGILVALH